MVQLRKLTLADKPALAQLANNKKLWDNLRDVMPHPYSEADAQFFIDLKAKDDPQQNFAITYQREFCGVIDVIPQQDVYRKTGEIGYWIGEPFWRKGIATEAIRQAVRYGFDVLRLHRIEAKVFEYNVGSKRVLEKNGFQLEGIARQAVYKNEQFWDAYCYGLLAK
ncbi:MAG: GNAT family protein [Bacteroidota bacterium]